MALNENDSPGWRKFGTMNRVAHYYIGGRSICRYRHGYVVVNNGTIKPLPAGAQFDKCKDCERKMARPSVAQRIVDGLREFTEALASGEPIEKRFRCTSIKRRK